MCRRCESRHRSDYHKGTDGYIPLPPEHSGKYSIYENLVDAIYARGDGSEQSLPGIVVNLFRAVRYTRPFADFESPVVDVLMGQKC